MATQVRMMSLRSLWSTGSERHLVLPRLVAGAPLLLIGLAHVFDSTAPMRPIVEAADLPAPALLSPLAVGAEILAGVLLLLGLYTRAGALIAVPVMAVAVYAHFAIDTWPNAAGEPPIALPVVVALAATYVLLRGAGPWSLDRLLHRR